MQPVVTELFQPRHSLIGPGSIREIPRFLEPLGLKKALVVSDKGLVKLGTVRRVTDVLDEANIPYTVFDAVQPNPSVEVVNASHDAFMRNGCDFIIAVGGGSPIDVGKAVSILSANGGKIEDYEGVGKSQKPGVPLIAVNTTAGTGSEVTRAYVVTDEIKKTKMVMFDNNCMAYLAINDPQLMVGMPPALTAATGMDALTHAIEAFLSNNHTPFTDGAAIEAIRLIGKSLRTVVHNGSSMQGRTDLCWAEYLAGLAFSNSGLGLVHAVAHQLGGMYHTPHGVANAILLPYVMEYNAPYRAERMCRIARALGGSTVGMTIAEGAQYCIELVRKLSSDIKIPRLIDTPFDPKDIPQMAAMAIKDATIQTNYVMPSVHDIEDILQKAYVEEMVQQVVSNVMQETK